MITVAASYDLEPLRCSTCAGRGWVDDTKNYLKQFNYFYDGAGPPSAPCRICYGTGRHVSRARAGLAAPPMMCFDIETSGLPSTAEMAKDRANLEATLRNLKIIDDPYVADTPEQRAKVRSWFDTPVWSMRTAPTWWSRAIDTMPRHAFDLPEHPPVFPDGVIPQALADELNAQLTSNKVLILGDPDEDDGREAV